MKRWQLTSTIFLKIADKFLRLVKFYLLKIGRILKPGNDFLAFFLLHF